MSLIQPVCQAYHFAMPVNDTHDATLQASNDHVETVRTEINSRNDLAAILTGLVCLFVQGGFLRETRIISGSVHSILAGRA